jgi:Ca-activated chloride channel family protein
MSKTEDLARTIVTVTDGFVSVEPQIFDIIRNSLGEANMFAFGIGSSVNRYLIEGMARVGMGEPFIITRPEQAPAIAGKFRQLIQTPVLTNIKLDYGKFEAYAVEPLGIPDLLVKRPVIVFGKYRGKPKGTIRLTGITGGRKRYEKSVHVSNVKPLEKNSALRYLWARHRIAVLADYNRLSPTDERVKEVTNLGLTYNLMTAYTSFVAVDTQKRLKEGRATFVKQPLPLPQGVSGYAVGGSAQSQLISRSKMKHFALPSLASKPMRAYQPAPAEESVKFKAEPPLSKGVGDVVQESSAAKKEDEKKQRHIELVDITVPGGWSKTNVETIVRSRLDSISQCYRKTPEKNGKLNFIFTVDTAGRVINVMADNGKKKMTQLEKCIRKALKKILFAPPSGGKNVEIKVSLRLKPDRRKDRSKTAY